MSKAFASQADLADKKITFEQLSAHCWAYTAEGDPNSGVVIGERSILVSDATATPAMARDLIAKIRTVSDKPIQYVLLTHYHAVRVLGASAFKAWPKALQSHAPKWRLPRWQSRHSSWALRGAAR